MPDIKDAKNFADPQPSPDASDHPPVLDLLIETLRQRSAAGDLKYGTKLRPFNGRDARVDLLQELADACMYVMQWIAETPQERATQAPSRQLHDALTEAGAMPHWELVATAQFLDQPDTLRLRVENGHLYVHGNAMTFAPSPDDRAAHVYAEAERDEARRQVHRIEEENGRLQSEVDLMTARYREANGESITLQRKLYNALGQLGQEQGGREQAETRCEELRRERDETRAEAETALAFMRRAEEERDTLKKQNADLRRQVEDWEAQAHKLRGAARTISIEPAEMRLVPMEDTSCTGRATAKVGPSSYVMRGCKHNEGHAGQCEPW